MKEVTLYTDGACSGNPGPGGWGAILVYKGVERELSGGEAATTNNRMELLAVIRGLEALKEPCAVTLCSDSKYVIDALSLGWAESWRQKGWMRNKKEPAKNPELWERLLDLCAGHEMRYVWVKGHAENEYNNRCDKLAVAESRKFGEQGSENREQGSTQDSVHIAQKASGKMKAITIKQPFATLIAEGYKEYEFRTWKTDYRGGIYIHAGKAVDKDAMKKFAHLGLDCPTGCILAKAVLTDCVEVDEELKQELRKKNFLVYSGTTEAKDWHCYGFHLEQVEKIDPIPAKGMLGLWEYEPEAETGQ